MGSPPHMALLPRGGPIQVAAPRVLVPRGVSPPVTSQRATGHLPSGQEDITDRPPVKWALHENFQVNQSPVTSHPATGHWTENINTGESQYSLATGQLATGHRPLVTYHQTLCQPSFSETHAMGMEFTNNNSKRVLLPHGTGL